MEASSLRTPSIEFVVHGQTGAVNPARTGTKAAAHYLFNIPPRAKRKRSDSDSSIPITPKIRCRLSPILRSVSHNGRRKRTNFTKV